MVTVVLAGLACADHLGDAREVEPTPESIGRSTEALVADDCENAKAYDGATKSFWKYCPDGYGTTVPFAVTTDYANAHPGEVASHAVVVDAGLDAKPGNFFPHDYDIPTVADRNDDPAAYDVALRNCKRFTWFTDSKDPAYPPYPTQSAVTSGHVCFGFGSTINKWFGLPDNDHTKDCKRLWMFDQRSWSSTDDKRYDDVMHADPAFVPWDPLTAPLSLGDDIAAKAPPTSATYPGQYHGYSYCRNKFFVWCALQGRPAKVMQTSAIITVSPAIDPATSPPTWSNDADLTIERGGAPVVTSSEMCMFWEHTGVMPTISNPRRFGPRRAGVTTCGGSI